MLVAGSRLDRPCNLLSSRLQSFLRPSVADDCDQHECWLRARGWIALATCFQAGCSRFSARASLTTATSMNAGCGLAVGSPLQPAFKQVAVVSPPERR